MPALDNFTFLYPYAFLLLPVFFLCDRYCKKRMTTLYFSNLAILQSAAGKRRSYFWLLRWLMLFLMILALANPVTQKESRLENGSGYEILLALDASNSMQDHDRFKITKKIVADFIDKRAADRLALSVFASYAYVVVPFTYDKQPLKDILQYLRLGVAGIENTALYEALYQSAQLFKNSKAKNKIVILLTDGLDNKKNVPLDIALANVKQEGLKVYTVAIGEAYEYDSKILGEIAKQTDGKFFETSDLSQLQKIYDTIDRLEKSKIETSRVTFVTYYFQYPLGLALLLFVLLYFFKRGRV